MTAPKSSRTHVEADVSRRRMEASASSTKRAARAGPVQWKDTHTSTRGIWRFVIRLPFLFWILLFKSLSLQMGGGKKNKQKPRRSEITTLCLLLKKRRERSASSASWRRDCGSQFADMPLVSESGCSGGGTGSIPAGRDESMQRERGREGGGREHMQEQVRVPFYFVSFLSPFQLKGNI